MTMKSNNLLLSSVCLKGHPFRYEPINNLRQTFMKNRLNKIIDFNIRNVCEMPTILNLIRSSFIVLEIKYLYRFRYPFGLSRYEV